MYPILYVGTKYLHLKDFQSTEISENANVFLYFRFILARQELGDFPTVSFTINDPGLSFNTHVSLYIKILLTV